MKQEDIVIFGTAFNLVYRKYHDFCWSHCYSYWICISYLECRKEKHITNHSSRPGIADYSSQSSVVGLA